MLNIRFFLLPVWLWSATYSGLWQIVVEEFLEDINNLLNSGEVPGLFEKDELEQVLAATRPKAKEAGISEENRDEVETKPGKIKKKCVHWFISFASEPRSFY